MVAYYATANSSDLPLLYSIREQRSNKNVRAPIMNASKNQDRGKSAKRDRAVVKVEL